MFDETTVAVEAVGKREWLSRGVAAVNVQVVVVIGDAWVIHGEASGGGRGDEQGGRSGSGS